MSEKKYIQSFVRTYGKVWVGAVVLGIIVGVLAVTQLRPSYEGALTFSLDKKTDTTQTDSSFYTYDGYYSEQAAVLTRNNFVAWLRAPSTVARVYEKANIPLSAGSVDEIATFFKTADVQNVNNVVASYRMSTESDTRAIGEAVTTLAQEEFAKDTIALTASTPLVLVVAPAKLLLTVATALAFGLLAFVVSMVTHYFRSEE